MVTNFEFLKKVDKNLYTIISEAELLYRDEYFEQCMVQTRRFGEQVCKDVLGERRKYEQTFDDMLATLKDNITGEEQEKEFIDDLYFLKKHGNNSAHALKVHKDGVEALECLQRAFEVAINYSVYTKNGSKSILKLHYDTELLVTGERTKESLSTRYKYAKQAASKQENRPSNTTKKTHKKIQQSYQMKTQQNHKHENRFWIFVYICSFVSILMLCIMAIIAKQII